MKTVVITGGSDGFGKALAIDLSNDHDVIITSRSEDKLKAIALNGGCDWQVCDVTDSEQVQQTFEKIVRDHKKIDVVINNAGVFLEGKLADASYEDLYNVINVNTIGALYVARASMSQMRRQKSGLLVNVVSQGGINTRPLRVAYTASKWALTGMTKSLQQEVADDGIRVTGFYPGVMETDFLKKAGINTMGASIDVAQAIGAVRYILSCDEHILIPELGIKNYKRLI